ncbi:hypothetical protein K1T71_012775 [Dendrolimus kikuchii]|uniref:Uncharacterized protein n=1 Tax=Dendrolimus kikuchii TaxID=765133 RepID=A0ACC1CKK7_9NEOP|nr:hypothetical protein K1T71_012775 [Dendrolimus kikuchii]
MDKATLLFLLISAHDAISLSSFWAPLFDPSILNYRVDVQFGPEGAKAVREEYAKRNGFRGARLIEELGNGRGPPRPAPNQAYGDVKFYYTYPGAGKNFHS